MNEHGSDAEKDFFVEGVRLYLDVDEVMSQFRTCVHDRCTRVVEKRLNEISQALGMHWKNGNLQDYRYTYSHGPLHLGTCVKIESLGKTYGGLYCVLEICRKHDGVACGAMAYFWRDNKKLGRDLWEPLSGCSSYTWDGEEKNCFLGWKREVSWNEIARFGEHLNGAIDDLIACLRSRFAKRVLP